MKQSSAGCPGLAVDSTGKPVERPTITSIKQSKRWRRVMLASAPGNIVTSRVYSVDCGCGRSPACDGGEEALPGAFESVAAFERYLQGRNWVYSLVNGWECPACHNHFNS